MTISKIEKGPFPPDSSSGANTANVQSKGSAAGQEEMFQPSENNGSQTEIRDTKVVSQKVIKFKDKDDGKKYSAVETKTHETDADGIEYDCTEIVYTNSSGEEVSVKERKHSGTKVWGNGREVKTTWSTEITKTPGKMVVVNKVEDPYSLEIETATTIGSRTKTERHLESKRKLCRMPEDYAKERFVRTVTIHSVRDGKVVSE